MLRYALVPLDTLPASAQPLPIDPTGALMPLSSRGARSSLATAWPPAFRFVPGCAVRGSPAGAPGATTASGDSFSPEAVRTSQERALELLDARQREAVERERRERALGLGCGHAVREAPR